MEHTNPPPARRWDVLLLGGASGAGKTAIAHRLARHFDLGLTPVDDFQVLLETMTTPEQQPALHFWRTHPDPGSLSAEDIVAQGHSLRQVMAVGLEAVIANHLDGQGPVLLEGDFISPTLAAQASFGGLANAGRVRAIFLMEDDEQQLLANFLQREPAGGPQAKRARVSWLYGQHLKAECARLGLAALPARPWETVFERVVAMLAGW